MSLESAACESAAFLFLGPLAMRWLETFAGLLVFAAAVWVIARRSARQAKGECWHCGATDGRHTNTCPIRPNFP